jgi:hypothetical protein
MFSKSWVYKLLIISSIGLSFALEFSAADYEKFDPIFWQTLDIIPTKTVHLEFMRPPIPATISGYSYKIGPAICPSCSNKAW